MNYSAYDKAYGNDSETVENLSTESSNDHGPVFSITDPRYFYQQKDKYPFILVLAYAPWCHHPCKRAQEKFEVLAKQYFTKVLFLKDNIAEEDRSIHRELCDVVPTYFIYHYGNIVEAHPGVDFDHVLAFLTSRFPETN